MRQSTAPAVRSFLRQGLPIDDAVVADDATIPDKDWMALIAEANREYAAPAL